MLHAGEVLRGLTGILGAGEVLRGLTGILGAGGVLRGLTGMIYRQSKDLRKNKGVGG